MDLVVIKIDPSSYSMEKPFGSFQFLELSSKDSILHT